MIKKKCDRSPYIDQSLSFIPLYFLQQHMISFDISGDDAAHQKFLDKDGRKGENYILSGDCIGMKEVFDILAEHTGLPTIKTILPAGVGKLLGSMSDMAEVMTHKPQRMTSFAVYNLVRNNQFDSSKAIAELGYSPRPMAQSIAEEIDRMLAEGIVSNPEPDTRSVGEKLVAINAQLEKRIAVGFKKVAEDVVKGCKTAERRITERCGI